MAVVFGACSLHRTHSTAQQSQPSQQATPSPTEEAAASPAPTPAPITVKINYAQAGDYLDSFTVIKFSSATVISNKIKAGKRTTLVHLEGGEPIWQIQPDEGVGTAMLTAVPFSNPKRKYAIKQIIYGVVPADFYQVHPDNGSPEPLDPSNYYIVAAERHSGTPSFQAIHMSADGTIESYDAEPRAGTSYELCCDLPAAWAPPAAQ